MNKFVCIFFVFTAFAGCPPDRPSNRALDREMAELLMARDFFSLKTALNNSGSQLPEARELYFRAHLESAFNKTKRSLLTIDLLFSSHKKSLNDPFIANLLIAKSKNHRRQFEYKQTAETLSALSNLIESSSNIRMDSVSQEQLKERVQYYESLENVPQQSIFQTKDAIIPTNKTAIGHLTMQVTCNGVTEEFVFDTGAAYSVIAESVADRMGIQPLNNDSIRINTHMGSLVEAKTGVVPGLRIGDLLFENVVFKIIPDRYLAFPSHNYSIRGVIGFPLIHQMKEIRIDHQAGNIVIPQTPVNQDLHNMFMDDLMPVVRLESGMDTLLFILDTGAMASSFSKNYFDARRESIIKKGQHRTTVHFGVGWAVEHEIYELTDVPFNIGNYEMILPKIQVQTEEFSYTKNYDGILGQDVLMHSGEMILNFESMYLTFND